MTDFLEFINSVMDENEIPYEYYEWTQDVTYPYFVGEYTESNYIYENEHISGTLTLYGWCRGTNRHATLAEYVDKIKNVFDDYQALQDNYLFFIRYGGSLYEPVTDDADLSMVSITLFVEEWKGEN